MLEINFTSFGSFKYMYNNTDTHMTHSTSHLLQYISGLMPVTLVEYTTAG